MKFIDLFAGLGGFHVGLEKLGHTCVFVSEIDLGLASLYERNFPIKVSGDIKKIPVTKIPKHQILCAGFPCQSFSQAGRRLGLQDDRGSLFYDIVKILKYHRPKYFILENVPNLLKHNEGKTWEIIRQTLEDLGYEVDKNYLSPHEFGIPQLRKRLFIVGSRDGLKKFSWPKPNYDVKKLTINSVLDEKPREAKPIPERELKCIETWQAFISSIPKNAELPSFPIWTTEFGATYPYEGRPPALLGADELAQFRGSFGASLRGLKKREQLLRLPTYAHGKKVFPGWKKDFIRQNREFYKKYKKQIDPIIPSIKKLPFSWQKFEWNCNGEVRDLFTKIIQFRASGIRVKRPNFSPALISSTSTQVPIIPWEKRYMTPREAARLQSLGDLELFSNTTASFRALGNAVNADLIYRIGKALVK